MARTTAGAPAGPNGRLNSRAPGFWHDGVVSFFLIFLAIMLIGVAVLLGTGVASKVFRRGAADRPFDDGFDEPVASLPPVLLPEDPEPSDVDHLRFAVGLRGYRMDQVDQVLDELRDQLAAKDRKIADLGEEVGRLRAAGQGR
jgi:DivIVA domain-containing protein